jgi:phasin family protein
MTTNDLNQQLSLMGKTALQSMRDLGNINAKMVEKLSEQQLAILNTCLEASSKEIEIVTSSHSPGELLAYQSALADEYNQRMIDIVRTTNEVLEECKAELHAWAEKGVDTATKTASGKSNGTLKGR